MNIRQALFSSVAMAVLAAPAPAGAQEALMLSAPVTTNLATASASGVSIRGVVTGQPESVSFSGQAQIGSRLVRDPDFGRPVLLLTIDLTGVSGVGQSTRAKYVIAGPEVVQRHFATSRSVEVTFPFMRSGSDGSSARTGVASFDLSFDSSTGAVTSAIGKVASPSF
jgi:hypothetical protein